MKVDNLLGPYLYQYKKLSLPGIGLFTLDEKALLPDETAKVKAPIEGISFQSKTGSQLDDSLIMYIKEATGKMKPLAEADLQSFITTGLQFLNIGKPFHIEGIGTVQKNKDGAYVFSPGTVIQHLEEAPVRYKDKDNSSKSAFSDEAVARGTRSGTGSVLIVLGILVTLGLIGWGGYYLYNSNTSHPIADTTAANNSTPVTGTDSSTAVPALDSNGKRPDSAAGPAPADSSAAKVLPAANAAVSPSGGYKFIFETTDKKARALKRYNQLKDVAVLKDYSNKVILETKDSLLFNICTVVPCPPADTSKIKDQLNAWYYGTKEIKVKIGR